MKTLFYILAISALIGVSSCSSPVHEKAGQKMTFSDDSLLNLIEYRTFQYFWDGAEPVSGLARERIHMDGIYPENDRDVITVGGSGFGLMAILVGAERGFITREQACGRLTQIAGYLAKADRFHGVWPHWLYGPTGKVKPFGTKDNGGDIVETAYLVQGLLAVRQYFVNGNEAEKQLAEKCDQLWKGVEWDWYRNGGQDVLYWHWSPEYQWEMNFPLQGYNECLITYILAASSPTHGIPAEVYHKGWERSGAIQGNFTKYGLTLKLKHNGSNEYGGPLFWSHYSFLGLDPRGLSDMYTSYWEHNTNHTLINYNYCVENPKHYKGYSANCWGLTASYSINGYAAHQPSEDLGVISPTAALSSFPYSPIQSMAAAHYFYNELGDKIWGKYGFYDAFSVHYNWYPQRYLAIDQGPIVVMIENYRSGLLWKLFMSCPEVQEGLQVLGFKVEK
jgi:hypothetical protein